MALGSSTFTDIGGAVSDIFSAQAYELKAQGNILEGEEYGVAQTLALQNEQFAKESTDIKSAQENRSIYQTLGGQRAEVASAGMAESGSALDILRDSAEQGALTTAVIQRQGLMEEANYAEQAQSYGLMQQAANVAAQADEKAATGAEWAAGIKGVAALASVIPSPTPAPN